MTIPVRSSAHSPDVRHGLHGQHADAALARAGDRPRRRRRDRGAREHLPACRGRRRADGGLNPRHQRDRLRRRRHDADARRGLCAHGLRDGAHGAALHRVRADPGGRCPRVGLRGADPDADDVRQAVAPAREARADLHGAGVLFRGDDQRLPPAPRRVAPGALDRHRRGPRDSGGRRLVLHAAPLRALAGRGPGHRLRAGRRARGLDPSPSRRNMPGASSQSCWPIPTSRRRSPSSASRR